MIEANIDLKEIAVGLSEDKDSFLKVIAAIYKTDMYGGNLEEDCCDLEEYEEYVSDDNQDMLINIQNTLANVDRDYENEDEEDWDEEDWEDEDWDEEDTEDGDTEVDEYTRNLIEENRRKNEQALGMNFEL